MHADRIDAADFRARFIDARLPCCIDGAQHGWKASGAWQTTQLLARLGSTRRCRIDDRPDDTVSLAAFLDYCPHTTDSRPRYVFDGKLPFDLAADYAAPPLVEQPGDNLFGLIEAPPAHRWLLIGGPRSGTGLHVDPLLTSAWNALVVGRKLWALFPPATSSDEAASSGSALTHAEDEALLQASGALPAHDWFEVSTRRLVPDSRSSRSLHNGAVSPSRGHCAELPAAHPRERLEGATAGTNRAAAGADGLRAGGLASRRAQPRARVRRRDAQRGAPRRLVAHAAARGGGGTPICCQGAGRSDGPQRRGALE